MLRATTFSPIPATGPDVASTQLTLPFREPLQVMAPANVSTSPIAAENNSALQNAAARFGAKPAWPLRSSSARITQALQKDFDPSDISSLVRYDDFLKAAGTPMQFSDFPTVTRERFGLSKNDPRVPTFHVAASEKINDTKKILNALKSKKVLIIVQGLDAGGKGGIIEKMGLTIPGVRTYAFKKPTADEAKEHFLERVRRQLPQPGEVVVFDRSHYEDYIVPVAEGLITPEAAAARLEELKNFERELEEAGTVILRIFANVSKEQQYEELMERLLDPDKIEKHDDKIKAALGNLKASAWDWVVRKNRDTYLKAQAEVMGFGEWLVTPNDARWFGRLLVSKYVMDRLEAIRPELDDELVAKARVAREAFLKEIAEKGIELK